MLNELLPNPSSIGDIPPVDYFRLEQADDSFPPSRCVTCKGPLPPEKTRIIKWYQSGNPNLPVVDTECDCAEQLKLYIYLLNSGIGKLYQRRGWLDAHSVPQNAQDEVLAYMAKAEAYVSRGIGLVLYGDIGVGKTLLATLWLKGMIARGYTGYFSLFSDILDLYQTSWRKDEEKREFERRITNAELLVIDDIGRENQGRLGVAGELVDRVIRTRVNHQRPTVITTNKTPDELAQLYSVNALSLLSGCSKTVIFSGADYRPAAQNRDDAEIDAGVVRPVVLA